MSTKPSPQNKNEVITDLRQAINNTVTKNVRFMGQMLPIKKLTMAECTEIQRLARDVDKDNVEGGMSLLQTVIRKGVPLAEDFEEEDFANFPMDELNHLSDEVLKFSGMRDPNAK